MRYIGIVFLICLLGIIACEDPGEGIPTIEHDPVGDFIGDAPMPSSMRARGQREPSRAPDLCKEACERANGEVHKVQPADNRYGWECICSWRS